MPAELDTQSKAVLKASLNWAAERNQRIILASTTGATARELLDMMQARSVRLIVVAHDPRRLSPDLRFDPAVIARLKESGHAFLEDRAPGLPSIKLTRWLDHLFGISALNRREKILEKTYGIGGKVCFLIVERAVRAGLVGKNETILAVAGSRAGVDTAMAFRIRETSPVQIELITRITA